MPDATTEFDNLTLFFLPQRATAFRTGNCGLSRFHRFLPHNRDAPGHGKTCQKRRDFLKWYDMICFHVTYGVRRHTWKHGIGWILDDGNAAAPLNFRQACSSIIEHPCEYDTNHPASVGCRSRPKKRINRRPVMVLLRTMR